MKRSSLEGALALFLSLLATDLAGQQSTPWPQGAGPDGNWHAEGPPAPTAFSVRTGQNIAWRTALPETGQGGIAVHGNRLFVATMAPWDPANALSPDEAAHYAHAIEKRTVVGKHIDGHCVDAATGKILWTRRIEGTVPSIYSYPFSDATSASPVTDGDHVWFTNAGGRVACYTVDGELAWKRDFDPTIEGPFNKQFEPFLILDDVGGDARQVLVHMEPFPAPEADGRWHYLIGLDAATGRQLWRSEDALTHYNAPTLVQTDAGPCILHARGGPHAVPERPVGVTLTRAAGPDAGKTVWRYEDPRGNTEASLQTMAHDERFAYWLLKKPHDLLVVLDITTGATVREISLTENVTVHAWSGEGDTWKPGVGTSLEQGVFPARYSMIAAGGHVFFQCYATAWGKRNIDPPWSFGRIDPVAGEACYLEVPTRVERRNGGDRWSWRTPGAAKAVNSRGEEVTGDDRSRWDGWDWVFNGSPTAVGDHLYFTLASGLVYVLDAANPRFDGKTLLALNDLGPAGETWSANSLSYANGRLYHRTARDLICVGGEAPDQAARSFPKDRIQPTRVVIRGPATKASIEVSLAPFSLDGETVRTTIRLDDVTLPSVDPEVLAGRSITFPRNPERGYIDGSIYIQARHHPVDVTRIDFRRDGPDKLIATIHARFLFTFEGLREFGDMAIELEAGVEIAVQDPTAEWRTAIDALLDDRYGDPEDTDALAKRMAKAGLDAHAAEALIRAPRREFTPPNIPRGKLVGGIQVACEHVDYETTMLLYVPEKLAKGPVPLVVVGHGGNGAMNASYAQRAAAGGTAPWTQQADKHAFIVAAPLTERGWGAIGNSILLSTISQLKRWYPIDPDRVHITGHSMGGHLTWRTALNMCDRFGGLVPMSGGYDFVDRDYMARFWNSTGYVTFGKREPYGIDKDNRTMRAWFAEHPAYRWTLVEKNGGHEIFADEMPKVADFVLANPRDPYPTSVYFEGGAPLAWTKAGANERWGVEHTWNPNRPLRQSISHWFYPHPNMDLPKGERQRAVARIDGQTVHVVSSNVRGVTIHLHPRMLDLARPVTVIVNGETAFEGPVQADIAHMLRTVRDFDDRGRVYHAAVEVSIESDREVPDPAEFSQSAK